MVYTSKRSLTIKSRKEDARQELNFRNLYRQTIGNDGTQSQVLSGAKASYARPVASANQWKRWDGKA